MFVRVPASTSNLGAGFDCLGLALDLWLTAQLLERRGEPEYSGTLAGLDPSRDLIQKTLGAGDLVAGRRLVVRSDIPVGKGFGSSAAAIVAGATLRQLANGQQLDRDAVFETAAASEGHPDNAGPAVYGGLVLAAHRPVQLQLHETLAPAFAVPERGVDTHAARGILPAEVARSVVIGQAARAAALVHGLTTGDRELITFGMDDQLAVPHRRHLIPGYDAAVRAGMDAGGCGVTISGAGSALFAIAPKTRTPQVAAAMAEALTAAGNPAEPLTPAVSLIGLDVDRETRDARRKTRDARTRGRRR